MKCFKVPWQEAEIEFVEKKSRFIGHIYKVQTPEQCQEILAAVRKKYWDATHNVYAYVLKSGAMRYSDDGEPGGTAGMPIMDTLIRSNTQDALIVVTRYFGGILLGSGGLVRAYSRSASDALNASGSCDMVPASMVGFTIDYTRYGALEGFVRSNSVVKETEFLENVRFSCLVEKEKTDDFIKEIIERTDGRAKPVISGEEYLRK